MTLEQIHEGAPSLSLYPTQEEYDAWYDYYKAQTREATGDPENDFLFIDLNDAVMNYLTLTFLVKRHPELAKRAQEVIDDVVRNAMGPDGGMVLGSAYIAKELGADPEEAHRIMFHDIFANQEESNDES